MSCMRLLSPESKKQTTNLSPEELLFCLRLPTIDDTQTAFAKKGLHISETTAARWRELANDESVILIHEEEHIEEKAPCHSCWNWFVSIIENKATPQN